MSLLDALIVGIVQGLTEFIPVSSSGHLVVVRYFVPVHDLSLSYIILLHLGTLVAVFAALWKDIYTLIRSFITGEGYGRKIALAIIIATIPGVFFGYFFSSTIDHIFVEQGITIGNVPIEPFKFVGVALIITAAYFLGTIDTVIAEREESGETGFGHDKITNKNAFIIGCAQALAVFPGISRSGATIAAGLKNGLSRDFAVRFSFIMSIPIILGSCLYDIMSNWSELHTTMTYEPESFGIMWIGVAASAVSGFIAVKWMIKLITTKNLKPFAVYLWILGLICIAS